MRSLTPYRGLVSAALLGLAMLLGGCAATPTRVTLMPDQDGHVGSVEIATTTGRQRIDQAYGSVAIADAAAPPGAPQAVERQAFEQAHRALLDAQPTPPRSFVLHFNFDSMELTAESRALLADVLQAVRSRRPTDVTVFGYTDSAGTAAYNLALSAKRANTVAALLKKLAPDVPVAVHYFGDQSPLVPTPPGVPEPRNRRVEIVVL